MGAKRFAIPLTLPQGERCELGKQSFAFTQSVVSRLTPLLNCFSSSTSKMFTEIVMQQPRATARFFRALSIILFLLCPLPSPAQLTTLRVGTNFSGEHGSFMRDVIKAIRLS